MWGLGRDTRHSSQPETRLARDHDGGTEMPGPVAPSLARTATPSNEPRARAGLTGEPHLGRRWVSTVRYLQCSTQARQVPYEPVTADFSRLPALTGLVLIGPARPQSRLALARSPAIEDGGLDDARVPR